MANVTRLIEGIPIIINGADERGERIGSQLTQLIYTLQRLPVQHLEHIPPITIGINPIDGGGYAFPGQYTGSPYGFIRLNYNIWDRRVRPWNIGHINVTLLHEVGHVIDWAFQCTNNMSEVDRQILFDPSYEGHTHGPGEHFAQPIPRFILNHLLFFRHEGKFYSEVRHL